MRKLGSGLNLSLQAALRDQPCTAHWSGASEFYRGGSGSTNPKCCNTTVSTTQGRSGGVRRWQSFESRDFEASNGF